MADIVIGVLDDAECGKTPLLPFVATRFDGKHFTALAKTYLSAALLRCGFDVFDCNPSSVALDRADIAMRTTRRNADALIELSFSAFGSRKSFNDVCGTELFYPVGRFSKRSRVLAEDICARFGFDRTARVNADAEMLVSGCPAVCVRVGYLTCFDEAKLVYDPDFAVSVAELIALGACEHFDIPYVRRDDISSYPLLCNARRGKKVKMLQCLLNGCGASLPIDGVYGASTDAAVKSLCENKSEKRDGTADSEVWRELLLLDKTELVFGEKNALALYVQRKLYSKLYKLELSGVYDEGTLTALNEFLRDTVGGDYKLTKDEPIDNNIFKLLQPVGGGRPRLF